MGSLSNPGSAQFNPTQPKEAKSRTQPNEPNPTQRTAWVNPPKARPIGCVEYGIAGSTLNDQ